MISQTLLAEKLLNYIYNVILSNNNNNLTLKDKFHRNFKPISILLMLTFSIGMAFSTIISYFISASILEDNKYYHILQPHSYLNSNNSISYSSIQSNILKRNIFNHNGNIPFEDTAEGSATFIVKNFDTVPCSLNEKLPVMLVGIIFTGNPKTNLVTLKDPKISIADVYREGQEIIDNDGFSVYKVASSESALFRHGNKKICVSLSPQNYNMESPASLNDASSENVTLNLTFVAEQLGPGFSTILNSARMVPQIVDGKTTGFKIFAISKESLFDKIHLQNGDIIKNVNGINLEDASQGFKIYEAFQDENNITLQIERNGVVSSKRIIVQ